MRMDPLALRVVRRFRAELLTKQWLMGVRRGWLSLMNVKPHGWSGVFKAFDHLREFVDNLEAQVSHVRRGPYTSLPSTESQALKAAFKNLRETLSDMRRSAQHWMEVEHQGPDFLGRGSFTPDQGVHMRERYENHFPECLTTHVPTKINPSKDRWNPTREGSITELLDKVLEILRADAARLDKAIKTEEAIGINETKPAFEEPSYTQFELHGIKVVVDDTTVTHNEIKKYVGFLYEAYEKLKAKHLQKVWYGTVFIRCKDCGGVNYNTGKEGDVGGYFTIGPDVVTIFVRPSWFIVELMAHELGHRYWFKFMSPGQRGKFESLVKGHKSRRPLDKKPNLIPGSKVQDAKAKVDAAAKGIRSWTIPLKSNTKKWFRDIIKENIEILGKAGWTFYNDLIDACHSVGANSTITPEIKRLFEEMLEAGTEVRKYCDDFEESMNRVVHAEPEPAKKPDSVDKYWMDVFVGRISAQVAKRALNPWLEKLDEKIETAVTTAYIYIDAAVLEYNKEEEGRTSEAWKKYHEEYEKDERSVVPVSDYGKSNVDEAFAEVFAHYVLEFEITRDQLESFRSVLSSASMDDSTWTPSVFANKVILQFIQHILSEDMMVEPQDYLVIRTVYRGCKGSWDRLADGDIVMLELLQKIISAWGNMPGRKHNSDVLI